MSISRNLGNPPRIGPGWMCSIPYKEEAWEVHIEYHSVTVFTINGQLGSTCSPPLGTLIRALQYSPVHMISELRLTLFDNLFPVREGILHGDKASTVVKST